jgi:copper oxidase (laccase) domain-containing protein
MSLPREWLVPDWDAPARVRAFVTTRSGGVSGGEFASMNLGGSGGDDPAHVARNRLIVREQLPAAPRWMKQVHGTDVADLDVLGESQVPLADAAVPSTPGSIRVVPPADCMPLFLADESGERVAVTRRWRGCRRRDREDGGGDGLQPRASWRGWVRPSARRRSRWAGGPRGVLADDPDAGGAFRSHKPGKFMADLYSLARRRLASAGVLRVHGGGLCTYTETQRFFSYRRAQKSGRMGAFIWIEPA